MQQNYSRMNAKKIILLLALFSGQILAEEPSEELSRQLNEVVVTANQPATKLVGSTLVTTIPGSNLADLGTALDVLAQLPLIKVENTAVSVIGKSGVEIIIDGRPMRDDFELQQILSSGLQKVELLMAPGAEYESTTGAVIKITTKQNFMQGLSLTDQFQLERNRKWSAMDFLSLNYRHKDLELFVSGMFNHDNSLNIGKTINSLIYNDKPTVIRSSQRSTSPSNVGVIKAGFNYSRSSQSFGAYYRFNPERGDFTNSGAEWIDDFEPVSRQIHKRIKAQGHLLSTYYENKFADKYLLHFDGDFRQSLSKNRVSTDYCSEEFADVNSAYRRESSLWAGKLYLNFPLWRGDFTAGTQDSYTRTELDFRMLNTEVNEYIPSSTTDARQTSAALFASWARNFGKLSLTFGVRYEFIDYNFMVNGVRDEEISRKDHLLTPNLSLGYSFNDDTQISASYKQATVRPPYAQLTGALNYVGRHEIEGGNPALRDERMHDFQLFGSWRGLMMQANFTRSIDTYAYVKQPLHATDLQLLMHPMNIDVSAVSVFLIWGQPIRCWTPQVTLGMYRQWLTFDGLRHNKPIFSYYFDNTFALPRGWTLTANFGGRSRGDMHTNRFGATPFTMDASIGKTLLDKSLTIKLQASDIFNTLNADWTMQTYGVHVDKRQSYDNRGLTLSVIYTLNPRKSQYRGDSAAQSESDRL